MKWTYELCKAEALKYSTKKDYSKYNHSSYSRAHKKGWIEEICSHMISLGNRYEKCVYVYEFEDRSVYVGITHNVKERDKRHRSDKNSAVYQKIKVSQLESFKELTGYINRNEAAKIEISKVQEYKNMGWNILNRTKAGSLGINELIWTYEKCREAALSCTTRNEFLRKYRGAHKSATIHGWIGDLQKHMISVVKPKNFWTKEECQLLSIECNTKNEFRLRSESAYQISVRNKWINEFFKPS